MVSRPQRNIEDRDARRLYRDRRYVEGRLSRAPLHVPRGIPSDPDRPAQWYPGPSETLKIETPDDYTVIVDTSKGGYPAHLFMFLAAFLPILIGRRNGIPAPAKH